MSSGAIDPLAEIQQQRAKYMNDTHYFNDYNEIYNLNTHLLDANTLEQQKLYRINEQLKTKLMKMKQDYMLTDYAIHEIGLYNNMLAFTILTICILLMIVLKTSNNIMLIFICIVVGVIYLIIVIIILKSNANRRTYSWGQWYWNPMNEKQ